MALNNIVDNLIHHYVSLSRKDEQDLIRYCGSCKSLINLQDRPILLTQEQRSVLHRLYPPHDETGRLQYTRGMCPPCTYKFENKIE